MEWLTHVQEHFELKCIQVPYIIGGTISSRIMYVLFDLSKAGRLIGARKAMKCCKLYCSRFYQYSISVERVKYNYKLIMYKVCH